jgi:hypothetical protein
MSERSWPTLTVGLCLRLACAGLIQDLSAGAANAQAAPPSGEVASPPTAASDPPPMAAPSQPIAVPRTAEPLEPPPDTFQPEPSKPSAGRIEPAAGPPADQSQMSESANPPDEMDTGDEWGPHMEGLQAGPLTFHLLLQPRYAQTFAEPSTNLRPGYATREDILVRDGDGWSLQRFFFRIGADPEPWVGFKAILDFAKLRGSNVSNVLKQAYARLRPIQGHFDIAAGIFKLPFSILELDPVAEYELTDLGDADNFIKDLGFAGRDIGAEIMVTPLSRPKRLRISVGVFRGHAQDENASPVGAIGMRVESKPWKWLRIGADVVGMPSGATYKQPFETSGKDVLPMPPDPLYPRERRWAAGKAYSADISFAKKHWRIRLEGMLGDRVDVDTRYGARSWMAGWVLVGYKFRAGPIALMPAARAEWLDTDREHSVGGRRELTLGMNVFFSQTVQLLVDVTRTDVANGTPVIEQPLPLPAIPYFDLDNTRVTAQLQLQI